MICKNCGVKNPDKLSYCAKCSSPLNDNSMVKTINDKNNTHFTQISIMMFAMIIVMLISLVVLPMFHLQKTLVGIDFQVLGVTANIIGSDSEDKSIISNFISETESEITDTVSTSFEGIIFTIMSFGMLITLILITVGFLTKNYILQNFSSVLNVAFLLVALLDAQMLKSEIQSSFVINIGFVLYLVAGISVIYLTQSINKNIHTVSITGMVISILGLILWIYGNISKATPNLSYDLIMNNAVGGPSVFEEIGIAAVIIGGLISIIGFELLIYSDTQGNAIQRNFPSSTVGES